MYPQRTETLTPDYEDLIVDLEEGRGQRHKSAYDTHFGGLMDALKSHGDDEHSGCAPEERIETGRQDICL